MLVSMCPYCQNTRAYGNPDEDDEIGIISAVGLQHIRIMQGSSKEWFLFYSDGEPYDSDWHPNPDGKHCDYVALGDPIHYCPNCGRKLD